MGAEWADTVSLSNNERLEMALTELAMLESLLDGPLTSFGLMFHFQDRLRVSGMMTPVYTRHAGSFEEYVEQAIHQSSTLVRTEFRITLTRIGELRINYLRRQRIPLLR